jgi:endonuclease/exonuclease/phosphatase family metal-dependent hydrolase
MVFGIMGVLTCIYFTIGSPTILARWVEGNDLAITSALLASLTTFSIIMAIRPTWLNKLGTRGVWAWNLAFIVANLVTILANSTLLDQPLQPSGIGVLQQFPLYAAVVLSPILLIDFILLCRDLLQSKPSFPRLIGSFCLVSIYLIVIILAAVFTITWDYIPYIGPLFRDMLWGVLLVICLVACLPAFLTKLHVTPFPTISLTSRKKVAVVGVLGLLMVSGITGIIMTASAPLTPPSSPISLKILTYNIQQGADPYGNRAFDSQLAVLKTADADIIGLEESDLARVSGANLDIVRYFADNLNLYSYYGPKTVTGTFGIALLSKYPITNAQTFYMPSTGEQTACIQAQIVVGSTTYNVFVTHLGNQGPIGQLFTVLNRTVQVENVILMGDLNFENGTTQWQAANATLRDAWYQRWPSGQDDQGYWGYTGSSIHHDKILDHIFLSPSLTVTDCRVITSAITSDHMPLITTILA